MNREMLQDIFGKDRRYYRRVLWFYVRVPRWWFEKGEMNG